MKYNTYELTYDSDNIIESKTSEDIPEVIKDTLITIENEIILEYLGKQKNTLGITKLGNALKSNNILEKCFFNSISKNQNNHHDQSSD